MTDARPTNVRYGVLAWACSLSMLTYIDRVCIKNVAGDMQTDLDIDKTDFGWVFSAFGLAYALFEVPSGWLGDRYGPRAVLCRIVLWWSFFTALTGCVWHFHNPLGFSMPIPYPLTEWFESVPLAINSLVMLIAIRFLFGMGEAGAYPVTARALRSWFPYTRRGFAQGCMWAFGRWGGAIAPGLILGLMVPFGWRGGFFAFGIVGVVWVIFFSRFFRNSPAEHPGVNDAERAYIQDKGDERVNMPLSWRTMLRSRTLWCLAGMYFCSNAGWCFFITWDVEYYKNVLTLEETDLTLASGAPLFFGGFACILGGFTTDRLVRLWGPRWGRTLQGFAACGLSATCFLLALAAETPLAAVFFLCLASFCKDLSLAVSWSTCIDIGHRYSGTVAGFMNGVGNLGTFAAPPIVAHLAAKGHWHLALIFSASMFSVACAAWVFINPRRVIVYTAADREILRAQGILA
jgi:MFS family permease